MNILVCVKQVPDIDRIGVSTGADGRVTLDDVDEFRMNRFDEFAVEAALEIKAAEGAGASVRIDALSVGPARCQEVLRRAMGMGADKGIHLMTGADVGLSPGVVAAGIGRHAAEGNYDLILCGSMSEDGMHAQVGPMVAGRLKWPAAIQALRLAVVDDGRGILLEKEVEGGHRERLRLRLPAVVAVQPGINRPRYPALSNLLRANAQELETVALEALGPPPLHPHLVGMALPRRARAGRVLEGAPAEKAMKLLTILREKALIE
jgi:electron transfer flavoprotein beta subunit